MNYILSAHCKWGGSGVRVPLYESLPDLRQAELSEALESGENTELFERGVYTQWQVLLNDTPCELEYLYANDRKIDLSQIESKPFLLQFGLVQFRAVIRRGTDQLTLTSKYCSAMNSADGENIRNMMKEILQIGENGLRELLEWPSYTPEEDSHREKTEQENYSMLSGVWVSGAEQISMSWAIVDKIRKTYERHGGYFLTRPAFTVKKQSVPVQFHQVKQLNRDSMVWSVQNGQMRAVPVSDRGIQVRGQRYIPIRTLSETSERDYCIYENQVVAGFLKTVLRSLNQEKAVAELPQFSILKIPFCMEQVQGSHQRDEELEKLQKQYQRYLHLENRQILQVTRMPRQTKRFLEIQPYRDIYQCISQWFRHQRTLEFGDGAIFKGRLADVIYEYFCWMQLLQMFREHGWQKSTASERITYEWDDPKKAAPQFSNIVHLKKDGCPSLTLYFEPRIPPLRRRPANDHGLALFRLADSLTGWTPDYVIKVGDGGRAQYAVFDAKFRPMEQLFERHKPKDAVLCAMEDTLYKYFVAMAAPDLGRPIRMVWLLQGRADQTAETWVERNCDSDHLSFLTGKMLGDLSWGAASLNSTNAAQWREVFWKKFKESMLEPQQ